MPDLCRIPVNQVPRVRLFATGGTIASRRDPVTGAVAASLDGPALLERIPDLETVARIDAETVISVNGWNMTPVLMVQLARRVNRALARDDIDGAIITHGTDTVEETAFLLDLLLDSPKPVVFAVALRHLDELGTDGPRNLRDAVIVAANPGSRERGTLLVANQTIHTARHVTKLHTTNLNAFGSPGPGPAGYVSGGEVRFFHPPAPGWTMAVDEIEERVLLVKAYAGQDGAMLRWALASGVRGVVIEGTGSGNVPAAMVPGIEMALAAGLPVVLCSRVPEGPLAASYGGGAAARGGGYDLARLGVIPASGLPGQKARLLLMVALGQSADLDQVRRTFAAWAAGDNNAA